MSKMFKTLSLSARQNGQVSKDGKSAKGKNGNAATNKDKSKGKAREDEEDEDDDLSQGDLDVIYSKCVRTLEDDPTR